MTDLATVAVAIGARGWGRKNLKDVTETDVVLTDEEVAQRERQAGAFYNEDDVPFATQQALDLATSYGLTSGDFTGREGPFTVEQIEQALADKTAPAR